MAQPTEMTFGLFLDSGESKEACVTWGAHWHNLANTTEQFIVAVMQPFC